MLDGIYNLNLKLITNIYNKSKYFLQCVKAYDVKSPILHSMETFVLTLKKTQIKL